MADNTKPILTTEEHLDLISELVKTHSLSMLAARFGCGLSAVHKFLKKHKLQTSNGSLKRKIEDNLEIIKEMAPHYDVSEIASKFGISTPYLRSFFKSSHIKTRQEVQRENILNLLYEHSASMHLEEFSLKFGFPRSVVKSIATKNGVEFSNRHRLESMKSEIEALIHSLPLHDAAKILNIPRASLLGYVKRNKLPYTKVPNKERLPGHIVYAYYDKDGVVRYYGEGAKEERAYHFNGHPSKGFTKYFSEYNPEVRILHYGLSKEEAQRIEQELVTENLNTVATIYNHPVTSRRKKSIDFETINNLVYYDETSPTCLRWKVTDGYGNKVAGKQAGHLSKRGYSDLHLSKLGTFKCHVIVWLLHNKTIDVSKCIDHVDGNRENNRIDNLREVTHSDNGKNRESRTNTGYKNLHLHKHKNAYYVYWSENGKRQHVFFKVSDYASAEEALQKSLAFRLEKIEQGLIIARDN